MLMGILRKLFQEVVVPELRQIRAETAEVKATLQVTNKRLDDVHADLMDLSRRIDAVRAELTERIDETNDRLNRLYEVIVRRDEHDGLAQRVARLEQKVEDLATRLAA